MSSTIELTVHAEQRMAEMHLNVEEIADALNEPEITKCRRDGRREYVGRRIIVVVNADETRVITLLPRTYQEYSRPDTKPGSRYYGRPMAS